MAWKLSEKLSCSIEALKQEGLPFTANAGIQYWTENALLLRGGVSTSTAEISFLAAWKWSKVMIGSSCRFHPQIGTMAGLVFYYYPKTFLN
jgi:hypothetical protein